MKYFNGGSGLQLRKFLSIALSISMVTLAMPINVSAVTPTPITPTEINPTEITPTPITPTEINPTEITPTPITPTEITPTEINPTEITPTEITPTEITPGKFTKMKNLRYLQELSNDCRNIKKMMIRKPLGLPLALEENDWFDVEAIGVLADGRWCVGENLKKACGGIIWDSQNPMGGRENIVAQIDPISNGDNIWVRRIGIGNGHGVASVTAKCPKQPNAQIGKLLLDPPRVMDAFDQPPEVTPPPPSNTAPPPPQPSGGIGAGGILLIGAALAAAAAGIAVAAGGISSSSSSSGSSGSSGNCSGSYYWYNASCSSSSCASFFGGLYTSSTGPFCSSSNCTQWATTYNLVTSGCSSTASYTKRTQTPKNGCCAQKGIDF